MAKHINLSFKHLLLLLLLGTFNATANEKVSLRFGNYKLPIPSGYFLNATRALEESIIHFERVIYKKGIRFPESDFSVMGKEKCEEYCNLKSPPSYLTLTENKVIGLHEVILWTVNHTATLDGKNFTVGAIVSKDQVIVVVNNVSLWKEWYKKIESESLI
jgi:hypothetical protein